MNDDTLTTSTDAPNADAPTPTPAPTPKRKRASTVKHGLPADVLKRANAANSGADLARAFNMEGKRVRDIARRIGFYQSDASRTLKKYLEGGAPAFGKARADIIAAVAPAYLRARKSK